jgi:hypothetical protein
MVSFTSFSLLIVFEQSFWFSRLISLLTKVKRESISIVRNGIHWWFESMAKFDDYWTSIR